MFFFSSELGLQIFSKLVFRWYGELLECTQYWKCIKNNFRLAVCTTIDAPYIFWTPPEHEKTLKNNVLSKPNKSEGFAPSKLASTPQIVVQNFQQLLLKRKGKKKNNQHTDKEVFFVFIPGQF